MSFRRQLADYVSGATDKADAARDGPPDTIAAAALARHRQEGMALAFRARWVALLVFAIMLPLLASLSTALYFEGLILLLAIVGWLQQRAARAGRRTLGLLLIFADILIVTVALVAPHPFQPLDWPVPMHFRHEAFLFFFVFLAFGTLAYSWPTVLGIGVLTGITWLVAVVLIWAFVPADPALAAAAKQAFGHSPFLLDYLDPNSVLPWIRIQEIVALIVVAWILSTTVRRFSRLVLRQIRVERERTNLARYFSPNVVEELSRNDEPLKRIRTQNVTVMFVDIVGFTRFAAERPAEDVILTLRDFHGRMDSAIFRHGGTIDKYLGDGLMATFGTPAAGDRDAQNALACAAEMTTAIDAWNTERTASGEAPVNVSIGLHFGPAVLGDIGQNRLEFAVIGNTVNIASRIEGLTRQLGVRIAVTEAVLSQARRERSDDDGAGRPDPLRGFAPLGRHPVRGIEDELEIWGRD